MTSFTPMTRDEGVARRKNSVVIALVLFVMVVSFYVVTIVKLQGNVAKRMGMKSAGSAQTGQLVTTPTNKSKSSSPAQSN